MPEYSNAAILKGPEHLLGMIDRQRRFLLRVAMTPSPCPNCEKLVNQIEALGGDIECYRFDGGLMEFECPHCRTRLLDVVPLHGPLYFWARYK